MSRNTTASVCSNKATVVQDQPGYNNMSSEYNSTTGMIAILKTHSRSQLWIPYVLIGIGCVIFLAVHFWCYHKRNRERYLRKREELRLKCGLLERRRITTLMLARYQSKINAGNGKNPMTDDSFCSQNNVYFHIPPEENSLYENKDGYTNTGAIAGRLHMSASMPEGIKKSFDEEKIHAVYNQLKMVCKSDVNDEIDLFCNEIRDQSMVQGSAVHIPMHHHHHQHQQHYGIDGCDVTGCVYQSSNASSLLPPPIGIDTSLRPKANSVPNMNNQYNNHSNFSSSSPNWGQPNIPTNNSYEACSDLKHNNTDDLGRTTNQNASLNSSRYSAHPSITPKNKDLHEITTVDVKDKKALDKRYGISNMNNFGKTTSNGVRSSSDGISTQPDVRTVKSTPGDDNVISVSNPKVNITENECTEDFCVTPATPLIVSVDSDNTRHLRLKTPSLRSLDPRLAFEKSRYSSKHS